MRNVFDQYTQRENRITHALVTALAEDKKLLRDFVRWVTKKAAPAGKLHIVEQRLPGEPELTEEDPKSRGLPDAWIYDDKSWCLLIESKIAAELKNDQLRRHFQTALRRGFDTVNLLALDVSEPRHSLPGGVIFRRWQDVYTWLVSKRSESEWAVRVAQYLEVADSQWPEEGYLKEGTLTKFSGIPFSADEPYNYLEAKRVLKLALEELRKNKSLVRKVGLDPNLIGRSSITGKDGIAVWDFLRIKGATKDEAFTKNPHLTLSIEHDRLLAMITVPHSIKTVARRRLVDLGSDGFQEMISEVNTRLLKALHLAKGSAPRCIVVQRRYPSQRAAAIMDARIEYDLRTAFPSRSKKGNVKVQPQWLQATYDALCHKKSNLQLMFGAVFPYGFCPSTSKPEIIKAIADVWVACKPLLDVMQKGRY
ncbi:MAG: hypothetical protein WA635_12510 [Gallionella sp.]